MFSCTINNLYSLPAELFGIDERPHTFSYSELRNATEDFSSSNKLGEGGFGPVTKVYFLEDCCEGVPHWLI